uniref:Retroviral aspartyl protease n=1 Tax=Thermofilum adornatum TaxID=1365176 RepID=A0A7C1CDT8_9CREN
MGVFKVNAWVWNPSAPEKKVLLELLVDTGATYTVLPESLLKSLGVKPFRVARLRLADNRIVEKSLGEVGIEVEGHRASATPVVFGEEEVYLLGSVTMEQLGLAPDPISKRLKPVEALLMQIRNS